MRSGSLSTDMKLFSFGFNDLVLLSGSVPVFCSRKLQLVSANGRSCEIWAECMNMAPYSDPFLARKTVRNSHRVHSHKDEIMISFLQSAHMLHLYLHSHNRKRKWHNGVRKSGSRKSERFYNDDPSNKLLESRWWLSSATANMSHAARQQQRFDKLSYDCLPLGTWWNDETSLSWLSSFLFDVKSACWL